jgi:tetratricopeptide (TPR) repeat protein
VPRGSVFALALVGLITGCASRGPVLPNAVDEARAPASVDLVGVPFFPQEEYHCGPAALATALNYSGLALTPDELASRVYLPGKAGTLQVEMVAAVRRYDRIPYLIRPTLTALVAEVQANHPVIVFQNLGLAALPVWHFAVVVGYSNQGDDVLLRSGRHRRQTMSAFNFVRTWEASGKWGLVVLRQGELPAADDPDGYLRAVAGKEAVSGAGGLVDAYRAAVLRWPENPVARFGYANALQASGQLDAAVAQYRTLIAQHPNQTAALNNLADALNRQGCRAEALTIIDRALAGGPQAEPLRAVLEQTRREILSAGSVAVPEPSVCTD